MVLPPPPQPTINMYEHIFGTVCGICAGLSVKKGAKTLVFVFVGFLVAQVSPACRTG
jgi:FUN14 domain-containing protein 1